MIVVGQTRSCVRVYLARVEESCRISLGVLVHVSCSRARWVELSGKPERSIASVTCVKFQTLHCVIVFCTYSVIKSEFHVTSDSLQQVDGRSWRCDCQHHCRYVEWLPYDGVSTVPDLELGFQRGKNLGVKGFL